jgi:hypothetical protein
VEKSTENFAATLMLGEDGGWEYVVSFGFVGSSAVQGLHFLSPPSGVSSAGFHYGRA